MDDSAPSYRRPIAVASLIAGPALMSAGDLIHPSENEDAARQIALVVNDASRWYVAHLLLFVGLLLFVPGILALTKLAGERKPAAGHAARILMLISVGALSSVFVFEMLIGRFISDGAEPATAVALLETFQSSAVFLVILPGLLAFFVGSALFVVPLASAPGPFRWPALGFALGALLILGQIVSAEVLLSQIGNLVILVATTAFAVSILKERQLATLRPDPLDHDEQ